VPSKARIAGSAPHVPAIIPFDFGRIEKLSGLAVPQADAKRILEALGFAVKTDAKATVVSAPSWRPDIHGSADLVEEVIRIVGLDKIPATPMPRTRGITRTVLTEQQRRARRARRLLAGRGLVEVVTWSFLPRTHAAHFGGGSDALELDNPISVEMSSMRPSLLPGLLGAAQRNRNRGLADASLFELGQAYRGDRPQDQVICASGLRAGAAGLGGSGRHWSGNAADADLFAAKADAMALLAALGFDASKAQITRDAPAWFHPGRSGTLRLGPKVILAHFGDVHPSTLKLLDCTGPIAAFEVFLDAIPPEKRKSRARPALAAAELLPVRRDFAFVTDQQTAAGDIVRAAFGADKAVITDVSVFDVFTGGTLAPAKKSVAIEVTLQPSDKSFSDAEIEAIGAKIIAAVGKATGAEIRG
jgi:phenylalanyl-tRNA synthetase beta chain